MKRDSKLYIKDILESINAIEKFVRGMSFDEFAKDDKTSSAVIRKFEIIGEATKNVPEEVKKKFPNIPWKEMAGFRDKLIHFYFGIKYELVWNTIKIELPRLRPELEKVLDFLSEAE
ncbi:MAG: hypothetical protein DRG59_13380 [Deltaproteobacteria bacterium]|nr:MAG: hypothetical protein DRG59_13380 [Deltaproteobacteria bacterium]